MITPNGKGGGSITLNAHPSPANFNFSDAFGGKLDPNIAKGRPVTAG